MVPPCGSACVTKPASPLYRAPACCPRAASVPLRLCVRHRSLRVSGRAIFAKGKNMESCCGMMKFVFISRGEGETQRTPQRGAPTPPCAPAPFAFSHAEWTVGRGDAPPLQYSARLVACQPMVCRPGPGGFISGSGNSTQDGRPGFLRRYRPVK